MGPENNLEEIVDTYLVDLYDSFDPPSKDDEGRLKQLVNLSIYLPSKEDLVDDLISLSIANLLYKPKQSMHILKYLPHGKILPLLMENLDDPKYSAAAYETILYIGPSKAIVSALVNEVIENTDNCEKARNLLFGYGTDAIQYFIIPNRGSNRYKKMTHLINDIKRHSGIPVKQ